MKILKILVFLLTLNTFVMLGFILSIMTGKIVSERISVNVSRVIDGDTFESDIGKVRMLGINTPEKNQLGYKEAKDFLMKDIQGKQIELETSEKDKYGRNLGYVFYNNELVNRKILALGLASLYYYGPDEYYNEMKKAEEQARNNELGIWKKSVNSECLELVKLQWRENSRCTNQEQLVLNNKCSEMNLVLKDDATHIYQEKIPAGIFLMNFSCIWNDEGDSLYVYDNSGLMLFYRY